MPTDDQLYTYVILLIAVTFTGAVGAFIVGCCIYMYNAIKEALCIKTP